MAGIPDVAVRERRKHNQERHDEFRLRPPNKAVTINLAPANVRKEGERFDLPVAIGILGAMGMVKRLGRRLLAGAAEAAVGGSGSAASGILPK